MIELILFLLVGALLLFSLFFFARVNPQSQKGTEPRAEAEQALKDLELGLLSPDMVARIFAKQDFDYVASETPEEVQKLFFEERKKLALSWVSRVRRQVVRLRRFHLGSARYHSRLRFVTEVRLACDFAALLFACRALEIAVFLRGPYAAPPLVAVTTTTAARVCGASAASLSFLRPAHAGSFSGDSAGGPVV